MIAYVFWHWKRPDVPATDYERSQRAFHAALAAAPSAGFLHSFSGAFKGAPWACAGADAYEDWYLVDDFASLGFLNEAAVSASRAAPHDAAAKLAADGAGGVYRLRLGSAATAPAFAHWFRKPEGMRYEDLFTQLTPLVEQAGAALWMRQMVLGPAREFCLHASESIAMPAVFNPLIVPLRTIWENY